MKARFAAFTVAAIAAVGLTAVAAPAAAAPAPAELSIQTGTVTVRTANHQLWRLSLFVEPDGGGSDDPSSVTYSIDEDLMRTVTKPTPGYEGHDWDLYELPASTLSFDPGSGDGTLTTPSSTAALTTAKLAFHATNHHSLACTQGSETVYAGTLTGQLTLKTGLKNGGTIGGQNLTFQAGTKVSSDSGCEQAEPAAYTCLRSIELESYDLHHMLFGLATSRRKLLILEQDVGVKRPAGTTRGDVVGADQMTAPVFNKKAKTLQVLAGKTGLVTGSGTFTGGSISTSTQKCTVKSVRHTETDYENSTPRFTNTTGHALTGHPSLTPKITVQDGRDAEYTITTWK